MVLREVKRLSLRNVVFDTDTEYIRGIVKTIPQEQIKKELKAKLEANSDLVVE